MAYLRAMSRGRRPAILATAIVVLSILVLVGFEHPVIGAPAAQSPSTHFPWKGKGPRCSVHLPNAKLPGNFMTCPPKRVLLIGDSVALSMGVEMALHQQDWGTIVDDQAVIGCGYVTGYPIDYTGTFLSPNPACATADSKWLADVKTFKPQAIVVEMGWWDAQNHLINGSVASLGQTTYDTMLEQQIVGFVHQFQSASKAPIFLLSVPWMDPPAWPNGQQNPAASVTDHAEINSLIAAAARSSSSVHFIDIAPYITPSGQFEANVDGQVCRDTDGVHLYYKVPGKFSYVFTRCGEALSNGVLSTIRKALKKEH